MTMKFAEKKTSQSTYRITAGCKEVENLPKAKIIVVRVALQVKMCPVQN